VILFVICVPCICLGRERNNKKFLVVVHPQRWKEVAYKVWAGVPLPPEVTLSRHLHTITPSTQSMIYRRRQSHCHSAIFPPAPREATARVAMKDLTSLTVYISIYSRGG
jgi:hypothetical protein